MKWHLLPSSTFEASAERWDELNRVSGNSPLLATTFLAPLLQIFGTGRERLALCEDKDRQLISAAILTPRAPWVWETFQPSQAPLGAWIQRRDFATEALLRELMRSLPVTALCMGVTQQDPEIIERPVDGARLATVDYVATARLRIQGTFADYWQSRGKNLRHNMKKQRTKLEAEGIRPSLDVLTEKEDLRRAIAEYGILESAGWKAGRGTAIHPDNAQGRFYTLVLERFAEEHRARAYRYRFNDKVVAIDLCIEDDDCLIILKTTYDEAIKAYSPAFLLHQDAFSQLYASDGRIKRIEFYGRVMDWHLKWTDEVRTLYHVNSYRFAWVSRLRRTQPADNQPSNPTPTKEAAADEA